MQRTITKMALFIGCLSTLTGSVSADDITIEKLPEPAIRFAKDASLRVADIERELQTLSDSLRTQRPELLPRGLRHTDSSLQKEANKVLSAAKSLLEVESGIASQIERYRSALKSSAANYREVAVLYRAHGDDAKTKEVKDDYHELSKVYEAKALAVSGRADKLPMTVTANLAREVVTEGNLFIERLLESLSVGPVTDSERELLLGRLRKHGERCQSLTDELLRVIDPLFKGRATSEPMRPLSMSEGQSSDSTTFRGFLSGSSQSDARSIVGVTWTSRVKVRGIECQQRIQLRPGGSCTQLIYLARTSGLGPLLSRRTYTYELDQLGNLFVFSGGKLLETGKVTVNGEESWVYEIATNVADPSLSGKRITFFRDTTR